MRKPFTYLTVILLAAFFFSCASKNMEDTSKKEESTKEEVKKADAKKEEAKEEAAKETMDKAETKTEMAKTEEVPAADSGLSVETAVMATGVENLAPSGEGTEFTKDTARIYCFSKITGAKEETSIKHIWYHNDKMKAEIELPVKSSSWRTYSYKTIVPEFEGSWRVDIAGPSDKVLQSLKFEIK